MNNIPILISYGASKIHLSFLILRVLSCVNKSSIMEKSERAIIKRIMKFITVHPKGKLLFKIQFKNWLFSSPFCIFKLLLHKSKSYLVKFVENWFIKSFCYGLKLEVMAISLKIMRSCLLFAFSLTSHWWVSGALFDFKFILFMGNVFWIFFGGFIGFWGGA